MRARFDKKPALPLTEGLAPIQIFGEYQDCDITDLPRFAGTPARPLGGSSCFWVWLLRISGPNHRALRAQGDSRKRFASTRRRAGFGATPA
jgi:hypothetical protein